MTEADEDPVLFDCNGETLVGILHRPLQPGKRLGVLIIVGGPQYRVGSHRQFVLMARALAAAGYAVMRFDHRGIGDSASEPRSFEAIEDDILAAARAMREHLTSVDRIVLWGLCDAAGPIFLTPWDERMVSAAIVANPWVRTSAGEARAYVKYYYVRRIAQWSFWRKLIGGGVAYFKSIKEFMYAYRLSRRTVCELPSGADNNFADRMLAGFRSFGRPVLILLSERDLVAREFAELPSHQADWRLALQSSRVTIAQLADADHTFSDRSTLDRVEDICIQWLGKLACS